MTLRSKALKFLAIVFAGDILLLAMTASLVGLSDHLATEAEKSSKIVFDCATSVSVLMNSIQSLGYFGFQRSVPAKKLFFDSVDDVEENFKQLASTRVAYPADAQVINKIKVDCEVILSLLKRVRSDMESGEVPALLGPEQESFDGPGRVRVATVMARVRHSFDQLIKRHERLAAVEASRSQSLGAVVVALILVGALCNLIGCYVAVRFFVRSITERLAVISANTQNLSAGRPFLDLVEGHDEIAEMDKFFHEAAARLRAATARDRSILTGMTAGTITFGEDYAIEFSNPAFQKMTGYSSDEIDGKPLSFFIPSVEQLRRSTGSLANSDVTEAELVCKDDRKRAVELVFTSFETEEKNVYLCSLLDVSERAKLAETKRDFVALISDDLRSPLAVVQQTFTRLHNGDLGAISDQCRLMASRTLKECSRLIDLISDLLSLHKIETGRLVTDLKQTSFRAIAERSVFAVKTYADDSSVKIVLDGNEAGLEADENRLIQVFVNLFSNAIRYSPPDGVITLKWSSDHDSVVATVSDQGAGMAPDVLSGLFSKFTQTSLVDQKTGSGLGLAICKIIVEQHNGRIAVDSQIGKGTTFTVVLPRCSSGSHTEPILSYSAAGDSS